MAFLLAKSYPSEFSVGDQAEMEMALSMLSEGAAPGKCGILFPSSSWSQLYLEMSNIILWTACNMKVTHDHA